MHKWLTGSWCRDPDTDILQRSLYRDLAQVLLQDPAEKILTQTFLTRDPHIPISHKCSYRIRLRRSWHRHLAQENLIQRSCKSGPTGSWCKDLDTDILRRDPHTEILHKCFHSILLRRSWHRHLAPEILIQWSCTSAPKGSCWGDPNTDTLQRSSYRDLAQVLLQDPAEKILTHTSCTRNPHTPIYRILPRSSWQTFWQIDLAQEIRIQRSCTSGCRRSSCRDSDTEIWHIC